MGKVNIGDIFGNLKIIAEGEGKKYKGETHIRKSWVCECNCGFCDLKKIDVLEKNLLSNNSKSCGLKSKSHNGKNNKKHNQYIFHDENIEGIINENESFYIDIEDYDKIKNYSWCLLSKKNKYVITKIKEGDKYVTLFLHNLIMDNISKTTTVDHIDGNTLINTKWNLRKTTQNMNMKNLKKYNTNKTGVKGVYLNKNGQFVASIQFNKQKIFLGHFDKLEDASDARKEAELKYFKEYSREFGREVSNE